MKYLQIYLTSILANEKFLPQFGELTNFLREKGTYVTLFDNKIRIVVINTRTFNLPKKCYDITVFVEWCKQRVEYFLNKDIEEVERKYGKIL